MFKLSRTCTACGVERRKKGMLMYAPDTLLPYCANPALCNEKHINSSEQLVRRALESGTPQVAIPLIGDEEANQRYSERLTRQYQDAGIMDRVAQLVTKPTSVRVGDVDRCRYVVQLQDAHNLATMTDVFRYCIDKVREIEEGVPMGDYTPKVVELPPEPELELELELEPEPEPQRTNTDDGSEWTF